MNIFFSNFKKSLACSFLGCFLLLFWFCTAHSQDVPNQSTRTKSQIFDLLRNAVSDVRTVSSEFRQERRLSMLKQPVISSGRFAFEKPDKLRWETAGPDPFGFFVNGNEAQQWKGKDSARQPFDLQGNPVLKLIVDQIIAWTSGDFKAIEKQYAITVVRDNPVLFRLVPKSSREKKYIRQILISFEPDTNYAKRVEIVEQGGDSTVIEFFDMKININLDKSLFE